MFQTIFEKAQEDRKIVSLSIYGESSTWIGFVISYTTEQVSIEHISKFGRYDGIITLKIHLI